MIEALSLGTITLFLTINPLSKILLSPIIYKGLKEKQALQIIRTSNLIALSILLASCFLITPLLFFGLGIQENIFHIAAGIALITFSMIYIYSKNPQIIKEGGMRIASTPLGTPLIAGPAAIATTCAITVMLGYIPALLSILIVMSFNILLMYTGYRTMKKNPEKKIARVNLGFRMIGVILLIIGINFLINGIMGL